MTVVGTLLARDRRSRAPALITRAGSERSYHDVITNAYKAANVLRHLGAREGDTVAIPPEPSYQTVIAFLGAARLGAQVRFSPRAGVEASDRVVLIDAADESDTIPKPGTNLAVFGGSPMRPETTHWEAELWSENPGTPPSAVEPDDFLIVTAGGGCTHERVLANASAVVETFGLDADSRVVCRAGFDVPGVVATAVIAPLSCGGTLVLPGLDPAVEGLEATDPQAVANDADAAPTDANATAASTDTPRGDFAVVRDADAGGPTAVPEPRRIDPTQFAD